MNNESNSENKYLMCIKNTKGITVMSLVVTIIIMLILAAITIGFALNGGLFEKAKTAADKYTNSSERERIQLEDLYNKIGQYSEVEDVEGDPNASYQIGDEVTYRGEQFYVLEPCSAEQTTVTVLTKYNLNVYGTLQAPNASTDETWADFSSSYYWRTACIEYTDWATKKFDIGSLDAINDEGDAIAKAQSYANLKGGTNGRLMTYEEANSLKDSYGDMIWGKANKQGGGSSDYYLGYWLSSAAQDKNYTVWCANGENEKLETQDYTYSFKVSHGYTGSGADYHFTALGVIHNCGVRTVLTVQKSKVAKVE